MHLMSSVACRLVPMQHLFKAIKACTHSAKYRIIYLLVVGNPLLLYKVNEVHCVYDDDQNGKKKNPQKLSYRL